MDVFREVEASGSPYECGKQHGAACGDLIRKYLDVLLQQVNERPEILHGQTGNAAPRDRVTMQEMCRRARHFLPVFEEWTPDLVAEIDGIAAGAGLTFDEALVPNVRGHVARVPVLDGCTTFALTEPATGSGETLLAQNSDMDPPMKDLGIVLRQSVRGMPSTLMWTFAGLVGYHGLNELGLSNGANALGVGHWAEGILHYQWARLLLEQGSVADGIELAKKLPFASSANSIMADASGAVGDVEIAAGSDHVGEIRDSNGVLTHTNHFLDPELAVYDTFVDEMPDTLDRLRTLNNYTDTHRGGLSADSARILLSSHAEGGTGVCRHEPTVKTAASLIMNPKARTFEVCRGNPCVGSYKTYGFTGHLGGAM